VVGDDVRLAHVLFSTDPDVVGLYGKPMARNSQIWTDQYKLLLDGPRAGREELRRAAQAIREGAGSDTGSTTADAGREIRGLLASPPGLLSRPGNAQAKAAG